MNVDGDEYLAVGMPHLLRILSQHVEATVPTNDLACMSLNAKCKFTVLRCIELLV